MTQQHGLPDRRRLSISQITLTNRIPFDEQLRVTAEAGAAGIGLFSRMLPDELTSEKIAEAVTSYGLSVTVCVPEPFNMSPTQAFDASSGRKVRRGTEDNTDLMIENLRRLAPLQPATVVVIPGAQLEHSFTQAWHRACDGLGMLADEAARLGLHLALEPVHPRFSTDFSVLDTIDSALQMTNSIGRPNLGLLIDLFHVWESADLAAQIQRATGSIAAVHLADSARFPRSLVDRLPPGEGCIDVAGIMAMIIDTGFDGWFDCEVVSDDGSLGQSAYPDSVWKRAPADIARSCVSGFDRAVEHLRREHSLAVASGK